MTRKERAQIEGMIELLKTKQRLDQENLQHGTEVITMLTELLGGIDMYEITLKLIDWKSIKKRLIEGKEEYIGNKLYHAVIQQCMIEQRTNGLYEISDMYDISLLFSKSDVEILLNTMESVDRSHTKSDDVTLLLLHGQITWQVVEQDRIREQFGYKDMSEIEEDCKDD